MNGDAFIAILLIDENNRLLDYSMGHDVAAALAKAKLHRDYDADLTLYAYKTIEEIEIVGGELK